MPKKPERETQITTKKIIESSNFADELVKERSVYQRLEKQTVEIEKQFEVIFNQMRLNGQMMNSFFFDCDELSGLYKKCMSIAQKFRKVWSKKRYRKKERGFLGGMRRKKKRKKGRC